MARNEIKAKTTPAAQPGIVSVEFQNEMKEHNRGIWKRIREELWNAGIDPKQAANLFRVNKDIKARLVEKDGDDTSDIKASLILRVAKLCDIDPGVILYGRKEYEKIKAKREKEQSELLEKLKNPELSGVYSPQAREEMKKPHAKAVHHSAILAAAKQAATVDSFLTNAVFTNGVDTEALMKNVANAIADEGAKPLGKAEAK